MALTLFGLHGRPHDFAVTKIDAALADCVFFLDFSRPLEKRRWIGIVNRWIGPTIGLLVPVVHQGEEAGGYLIGVNRGEPYFIDLQNLWNKHFRSSRTIAASKVDGLRIIADFATHFPGDCN